MEKVALVGLGNLGSRHLQGLVRCPRPLEITLYDPSDAAVKVAVERWAEAGGEDSPHRIADGTADRYDIAIIATTADHRAKAIASLIENASVAQWLVEKPLAQSLADLDAIEGAIREKAWVNLARRSIPWHQEMAAEIEAVGGPKKVVIEGGAWGLAGNALHFADLVRWWSGSELESVETSGLDGGWHGSKRPGYSEVFGTLDLAYTDGSTLRLHSDPELGPHSISVETQEGVFRVEEKQGVLTRPDGSTLEGRMAFQSELTGGVVEAILEKGACALPTLPKIAALERTLLPAMIAHREAHGGPSGRLDVT